MSFHNVSAFTLLLLFLPPLLWGGNFVVGSVLATEISGIWMNILRWCVALLVLGPLCWTVAWRNRHVLARHWCRLCIMAALGVSGFNSILYLALHHASVPVAAIAFACTPFFILFIVAVLDRRWPSRRLLLASTIALSGMVLAQRHALMTDVAPLGVALVILSSLIWAGYCVCIRRLPVPAPPRAVFLAQVILGVLILAPVVFFLEPLDLTQLRTADWLGLAYLGVCAGAIAFWLWNLAIPRVGAARASLFMNLVPLSGIGLAAVFLDDPVGQTEAIAIVIVFLGIFISVERRKTQNRDVPTAT